MNGSKKRKGEDRRKETRRGRDGQVSEWVKGQHVHGWVAVWVTGHMWPLIRGYVGKVPSTKKQGAPLVRYVQKQH